MGLTDSFGFGDNNAGGGGGGSVNSVTGLNTDNTDPVNPIVALSTDGVTITGAGTPADPLISVGSSGVFTPTINTNTMKEVSQESDFGLAFGGTIFLDGNTTYFIRGTVICTNKLVISFPRTSIRGWDRDSAVLSYQPIQVAVSNGDFITITDVSTELIGFCLSSTNSFPGDLVLRANNFDFTQTVPGTYDVYNAGRDKVLTIINCQFRNCYDVLMIEGFDLCDIQNTLFWYIQAPEMGCHFRSVSKLQITSCEFVRWFDETSIPTPTGFSTTPLIQLLKSQIGASPGANFGAVNITGCIVHPQREQVGLDIASESVTGFGTISANTFINVGLTPNTQVATIRFTNATAIRGGVETFTDNANGTGYINTIVGSPATFTTTSNVTGSGATVLASVAGGVPTIISIIDQGLGYSTSSILTLDGGNNDATFSVDSFSNKNNVLVGGFQNYLATFVTDIGTTLNNFVSAYEQEFLYRWGIVLSSSTDTLTFTGQALGVVFDIDSSTAISGQLDGTLNQLTPIVGVVGDINYSTQNSYIIQANEGLRNANSKGGLIVTDNLNDLAVSGANTPIVFNSTNVTGGFTNSPYFPVGTKVITDRENCSFIYNQKNAGNFFVIVTTTVELANNGTITCILRNNGNAIPFATGSTEIKSGVKESMSFSVVGSANIGDVFDVTFQSSDGSDILVSQFQLNGYQF